MHIPIPNTLYLYTVNLYYHMKNIFINMLDMIHLKVCVTALTKLSKCQIGSDFLIVAVNFLLFLFLMHTLITTKM